MWVSSYSARVLCTLAAEVFAKKGYNQSAHNCTLLLDKIDRESVEQKLFSLAKICPFDPDNYRECHKKAVLFFPLITRTHRWKEPRESSQHAHYREIHK